MAGVTTRKNGGRFVTFYRDGLRRIIHLGKIEKRDAERIANHVQELVSSKLAGHAISQATAGWLKDIEDGLHYKLAKVGLVEPRKTAARVATETLKPFIDSYINGRTDLKPRSIINLKQARDWLVRFFTEDRRIDTITAGDAIDKYAPWLKSKVGDNTARIHLRRSKEFFKAAIREKLIVENPFAEMKGCTVKENRDRDCFVSREDAYKVLDCCPGTQWKLVFALARFAGLRCPSEIRLLRWSDINFAKNRMTIHSPKTEHHEGKDRRIIPIFDELRPYLEDAKLVAEPNAEFVVTLRPVRDDRHGNVATPMYRFVKRSGVRQWPKLFQNLRASRAIELAHEQPLHVAAEWMGHDIKTAEKFYLRVTEADFDVANGTAHPQAHPSSQIVEMEKTDDWKQLLRFCVEKAKESSNPEQLWVELGNAVKSTKLPRKGATLRGVARPKKDE